MRLFWYNITHLHELDQKVEMSKNPLVMPVLKWVGGKRQLLPELRRRMPKLFTRYYEPFIGGGALFFARQPTMAILNDSNWELINVYEQIRDSLDELVRELEQLQNNQETYYRVRQMDREPDFETLPRVKRAARILYLNKTCYNGLFRVNSHGEFNSPFGYYKNPNIVNKPVLAAVSTFLANRNLVFRCGDYAESLKGIRKGAFVYFDPPYDPVSSSASFTGYTQSGFDKEEQERLAEVCKALNRKGVKFMLSNADTKRIRKLYSDFTIETVQARRNVNSDGNKRGEVSEVIVRNYE